MTLDEFNRLCADTAAAALRECCASTAWARAVTRGRPFADMAALLAAAREAWGQTSKAERLAAFAAHPLIGDVQRLRERYDAAANTEQGQVLAASECTLRALAELNVAYHRRHGFIFIVCATGKSAEALLDALRQRIGRSTERELATAAAEQADITALRLRRLLEGDAPPAREAAQGSNGYG